MRIFGPVLEFDTVSKNKVIFSQSCKIATPHIIPVYFERDNFVIGYCEGLTVANVEKNTYIYAEAKLFYNVTFDDFDLNAKLMSGEKIGAGGIYNNIIKSHKTSSGVIVVDECTLDALLLTLTPAQDNCYFKMIEDAKLLV